MSSGRDEMMSNWKTDQEAEKEWKMKQLQRMIVFRQTLTTDINRLNAEIAQLVKELEEYGN